MCIRDRNRKEIIINNFTKKKVDDNYEIKMGVENSGETDKLNENKDDQLTHNTVSRGEKNDNIIKNMVLELSLIHIWFPFR